MHCFSKSSRDKLSKTGAEEIIDSIERTYALLTKRRVDKIRFGNPSNISEPARAIANCSLLRQSLLHRSDRLMLASAEMVAQKNIYAVAILVRGHFEATAVMGYFCHRISALRDKKIDFKDFALSAASALMGARHSLFSDSPKSISILTCLEKAAKYAVAKGSSPDPDMITDCYDWLSDFSHPNFLSQSLAFDLDKSGHEVSIRHSDSLKPEEINTIGYLDISATLFLEFFDDFESLCEVVLR